MSTKDTALFQQWTQHKDPEALAAIIRQHTSMVYATCMRILANPTDAQDITQECFIKFAKIPKINDSLPGLLHTMATRLSLNHLRAKKRRQSHEQAYAHSQTQNHQATWDDIQLYVDEAIAALPEKTRTAIIRSFFQGDTHEAISQDEGITRSAVTVRINRGLDTIHKNLIKRGLPISIALFTTLLTNQSAVAAPPILQESLINWAIAESITTPTTSALPITAKWSIYAILILGSSAWLYSITLNKNAPRETQSSKPVYMDSTFDELPQESSPKSGHDPELLLTILKAREKNQAAITTWQGKAKLRYSNAYDTHNHKSNTYELINFARDFKTNDVRWNRKIVERTTTEKSQRVITPATPQYWGGLVRDEVFYNYTPIIKTTQGEERNTVVIFKKGELTASAGNHDFDPILYTERQGVGPMDDTLRYYYKRRDIFTPQYLEKRKKEYIIVRDGDIVTWTEVFNNSNRKSTRSHTFDLAKGGSLISHKKSGIENNDTEFGFH